MSDDEVSGGTPIVIDIQSDRTLVGFAGDVVPRSNFPTVVGKPRHIGVSGLKSIYVGHEAISNQRILQLRYPLENGLITDWDGFEQILRHAFQNELRVAPDEQPILIAEHPGTPSTDREGLVQLLFDKFRVPAVYTQNRALLAAKATDALTGVVVHAEEVMTYVLPIYQGYALTYAAQSLSIGGRDLTEYMIRLLNDRGYSFTTALERQTACDIKTTLGRVVLDFADTLNNANADSEQSYERPDGEIVTVGSEAFRVPEALFQPSLLGRSEPGIHQLVFQAIAHVDASLHREMYETIIMSGPETLYMGLNERLENELRLLAPPAMKIKTPWQPEKKYLPWYGGAIWASDGTLPWISREIYEERGPAIVHKLAF